MARLKTSLLAVSLLLATPVALAARSTRVLLTTQPTRNLQHAPDGGINPSVKLSQTTPGDHIPNLDLADSPDAAMGTRKLLKTGNGAGSGGHDHYRETERVQMSSFSLQPLLAGVAAAAEFAHVESAATADRFAEVDRSALVYARDSTAAVGVLSTAAGVGARKLAAAAAPVASVLEGHACLKRQPTRHLS